MDMGFIILVFKLIVLVGALMSTWFGVMLIFFYEKFSALNEMLNNQYIVGRDKYGDGANYKLDSWVLGWHSILGVLCLLVAAWLFWTFYSYMSL